MRSPGKAAERLADLATGRMRTFSSDSSCFSSEIRRSFADSEVVERELEVRGEGRQYEITICDVIFSNDQFAVIAHFYEEKRAFSIKRHVDIYNHLVQTNPNDALFRN